MAPPELVRARSKEARSPPASLIQQTESLRRRSPLEAAAVADDVNSYMWPGDAGEGSDPDAGAANTAQVAEEVFMQHVTRVYKVNKQIWDYYSKLAAQQAQAAAAASGINRDVSVHTDAAQATWDDPTAFRFRTTGDDMPANLLPQQRTLATISVNRAAAQGTLSAKSRPLSVISRPLAAMSRQLTTGTPTPRQTSAPPSMNGSAAASGPKDHSSTAAADGVDAEAGGYYLQLRPSIFLLRVVSPEHKVAWFWSILMLVMDMVYIAFAMPLSAAFCPVVLGGLNWCTTVDLVAGLLYCVNLAVSFQIGFVLEHDYKKRLLLDGWQVARFYIIRGSFFIDAMAVLPVVYQVVMVSAHIENYWANRCLTFTMFLRLMRLVQLMKMLFVDSLITSGTNGLSRYISVLGQYALVALYAIAVLVHNLACLAWIVALVEGLESSWAKKVTFAGGEGNLPYASMPEQYLAAVYWVVTTATGTGYGDITPQAVGDVLMAMLFMLCGVGMIALLIGSIAELLTQATSDARRAHAFRQKMMEVDEWLLRRNLPSKLSKAVTNYYNQVWLQHRDHPTEARILSELPPFLRGRVASHITAELLDGVDVTMGLDQTVKEHLASRLVPVEVAPGHELCREGDDADCLWLLQEGELVRMQAHTSKVDLIWPPCWLGESCLLTEEYPQLQHRPATLRALSSCQLWQLSLREAHTLMANHPELGVRMMTAARQAAVFLSDGSMQQHHQQPPWRGVASRSSVSDNGQTRGIPTQRSLVAHSVPACHVVGAGPGYSMQRPSAALPGSISSGKQLRPGSSLGTISVPAAAEGLPPLMPGTKPRRNSRQGLVDLSARSVPVAAAAGGGGAGAGGTTLSPQSRQGLQVAPGSGTGSPAFGSSKTFPPLGRRSVPVAATGPDSGLGVTAGDVNMGLTRGRGSRGSSAGWPSLPTVFSTECGATPLAEPHGSHASSRLGPTSAAAAAGLAVAVLPSVSVQQQEQHQSIEELSAFADPSFAILVRDSGAHDVELGSPHSVNTQSSSNVSGMHGT